MIDSAMADNPPCHEQTTEDDSIMFMTDCMGVDLQSPGDDVYLKSPNIDYELVIYNSTFFDPNNIISGNNKNFIRGPPNWQLAAIYPNTLQVTQRFRN